MNRIKLVAMDAFIAVSMLGWAFIIIDAFIYKLH